jgi:hypothetical protein
MSRGSKPIFSGSQAGFAQADQPVDLRLTRRLISSGRGGAEADWDFAQQAAS